MKGIKVGDLTLIKEMQEGMAGAAEREQEKVEAITKFPPRRTIRSESGEDRAQLGVSIPVENLEWIKAYAKRHGISMNIAVAYAIYVLYEAENQQ